MSDDKTYEVPAEWKQRAFVDNAKYQEMYKASVADPNKFWGEQAKRIRRHGARRQREHRKRKAAAANLEKDGPGNPAGHVASHQLENGFHHESGR